MSKTESAFVCGGLLPLFSQSGHAPSCVERFPLFFFTGQLCWYPVWDKQVKMPKQGLHSYSFGSEERSIRGTRQLQMRNITSTSKSCKMYSEKKKPLHSCIIQSQSDGMIPWYHAAILRWINNNVLSGDPISRTSSERVFDSEDERKHAPLSLLLPATSAAFSLRLTLILYIVFVVSCQHFAVGFIFYTTMSVFITLIQPGYRWTY